MSIFRTATEQAIRDIITDHGCQGRFGVVLGEGELDAICGRITDLFEMTLQLRSRVQTALGGGETPPKAPSPERQAPRFPHTKDASQIYAPPVRLAKPMEPSLSAAPGGGAPLGLPRKRVAMSVDEHERVRQAYGK